MFKKTRIRLIIYIMAMLVVVLAGIIAIIYFTTYRELNTENRQMLELYAEQYSQYGTPADEESPDSGSLDGIPEDAPADAAAEEAADEDAADDGASVSDTADSPSSEDGSFSEDESGGSLSADDPDGGISRGAGDDAGSAAPDELEESSTQKKYMVSTFYSVAFSEDGTVLEINNEDVSGLDDETLAGLAASLLENSKEFGTDQDMVYLISEIDDFILVTMMDNTVLGETIDSLIRNTLIFGTVGLAVLFVISLIITRWIILPLETGYRKQKQFISDAGHELKTPVSTISANAELLSREIGENRWLSNIQYENSRMSALVKEMLDLAKLEGTKAELTRVNLSRIALAGVLPFEGVAFEAGLSLEYDIAENIFVNGNAARLEELVSILTDNALDHTKNGGKICIRLECIHSNAVFTAANEGDEIPKEQRELIFDRFYRTDEARSSGENHYGLGLSIAQAIVLSHGGKISVGCRDGFTEFKVTLPAK